MDDAMLDDIYGEDAILDSALAAAAATGVPADGGAADLAGYKQLYESIAQRDLAQHGAQVDATATETQALAAKLEAKTAECEQLKQNVAELQQQVKKLTRMKETLSTYISALYKTAAAELSRRDLQIKELNQKCAALPMIHTLVLQALNFWLSN